MSKISQRNKVKSQRRTNKTNKIQISLKHRKNNLRKASSKRNRKIKSIKRLNNQKKILYKKKI